MNILKYKAKHNCDIQIGFGTHFSSISIIKDKLYNIMKLEEHNKIVFRIYALQLEVDGYVLITPEKISENFISLREENIDKILCQ